MVVLNINYTRIQYHLIRVKKKFFTIAAVDDDRTRMIDEPRQPDDDIIPWLPYLYPDYYAYFSYNDLLENIAISAAIDADIRAIAKKYRRIG